MLTKISNLECQITIDNNNNILNINNQLKYNHLNSLLTIVDNNNYKFHLNNSRFNKNLK